MREGAFKSKLEGLRERGVTGDGDYRGGQTRSKPLFSLHLKKKPVESVTREK